MSKSVSITKLGTRELWEQFRANPIQVYQDATAQMKEAEIEDMPSFSRALEIISPSEKDDELDAFGRLMREAGIRTRSNPQAGWWASPASSFLQNSATRALMIEFGNREWRKVSHRAPEQRSLMLSDDELLGSVIRPWTDVRPLRWMEDMRPAIPLSELVAVTTPISGGEYRGLYLEWDEDAARMARVAEGTDIPLADIKTSPRVNDVHKYGRGIRTTYEALRRLRVDRIAWYFQMLAIQAETDKVSAAMDVLINGDGNPDTAAEVIDLTTLDPAATPGELTLEAWLAFKMSFNAPYMLTHALMQEDVALQLALLNSGSPNLPLSAVSVGGLGTMLVPINTFADGVRYGWTAEAPEDAILGYDGRLALERAVETGSLIQEQERFILNQTTVVTITENEGFGIMQRGVVKLLNLAA